MRKFAPLFYVAVLLTAAPVAGAAVLAISVFPDTVIQGEPLRVVVENVSSVAEIKKIIFDTKSVELFLFQGKPTALIGIDLKKKPGNYKIVVTLVDGTVIEKIIVIGERPKVEAPLGIPEKLGGNTPGAVKAVVSSLASENQSIYSVRTFPKSLWTEDFRFPILNPTVTDSYGYVRQTVGQFITHKGTDFSSKEGAVVKAMNRGIVRLARTYQIYGKTIIVDHGAGLMTLYMHLSKIKVNEGELVKQGQLIGLSGKTGYAESPHLHVSVWINKISVDPMKFMAIFQKRAL
ncbi:MAG: M23 family metallopeptidase [Patescibacteria group bacterium]